MEASRQRNIFKVLEGKKTQKTFNLGFFFYPAKIQKTEGEFKTFSDK